MIFFESPKENAETTTSTTYYLSMWRRGDHFMSLELYEAKILLQKYITSKGTCKKIKSTPKKKYIRVYIHSFGGHLIISKNIYPY